MDASLDGRVTATLNAPIDTVKYSSAITIAQNGEAIKGTVSTADSTVAFMPELELLPSTIYTATLLVATKENSIPAVSYTWSFTTKGPDEYGMTQRSTTVTDFNRDGTRMMQVGAYLYSFGGWAVPEESYNDIYRSRDDLTAWEKLPDAPWHGRHVFGVAKPDSFTYVVGGDNLHNTFDVWRTKDGEAWTLLSTNNLGNRIYYGCAAHNGYIYIIGGLWYSDVWRSRDGVAWERVADNIGFLKGENFAGSLASFNGKLYMVCGGGTGGGTGTPRKEVWSSTDGAVWKQEKDFGGSARYYTDVCVWDNKLWVINGYNYTESNIKSIWYMKRDGTWQEYDTPGGYIGRHATGVAVYNNKLAITCGNYNNDCWVIEKKQ